MAGCGGNSFMSMSEWNVLIGSFFISGPQVGRLYEYLNSYYARRGNKVMSIKGA